MVTDVIAEFREAGINGILSIGDVGTALGQTNVDINKVGMILIGGLNPIAAAYEDGFDVENKAMSTVMEFEELQSIEQI